MKLKDLTYPFICVGNLCFSSSGLGEKKSWEGSDATPWLLWVSLNDRERDGGIYLFLTWGEWPGGSGLSIFLTNIYLTCLEVVLLGADTESGLFPYSLWGHRKLQLADGLRAFKCLTHARRILADLILGSREEEEMRALTCLRGSSYWGTVGYVAQNTRENNRSQISSIASIVNSLFKKYSSREKCKSVGGGMLEETLLISAWAVSTRCLHVSKEARINPNLGSWKVTVTWFPSPLRPLNFVQKVGVSFAGGAPQTGAEAPHCQGSYRGIRIKLLDSWEYVGVSGPLHLWPVC